MTELAKWIWLQAMAMFAILEIRAGFAGLVLGIAMTDFLPRMMPARLDADLARRMTRLLVFGFASGATFWLDPTPLGLILAFTVGASASSVQAIMMRVVYARWPSIKPMSLTPSMFDREPPPSILRKDDEPTH